MKHILSQDTRTNPTTLADNGDGVRYGSEASGW